MATEIQEVQLRETALSWPERAKKVVIVDQESYDSATETLKKLAQFEYEVKDHYKDPKKKAEATHKAIVAAEKKILEPLQMAKRIIGITVADFTREQKRIREENKRKIREEEHRREEEERLKLAEQAAEKGASEETINEILDTQVTRSQIKVEDTFAKAGGVGVREYWKFEIYDVNLIPREYMIPDEVAIGQVVRGLKGKTNIPGVRVFSESSTSVRR